MFKVAEGVYTDNAAVAEQARIEAEWEPTWNPVEGKWEL